MRNGTMTNTILALIHNGNLSVDEAIEASFECGKHAEKEEWLYWEEPNASGEELPRRVQFQTLKSLTDLKKQFEAQGIKAVYLHEKEKQYCSGCDTELKEQYSKKTAYCDRVKKNVPILKKAEPLMLAVFGDESIVRGLV